MTPETFLAAAALALALMPVLLLVVRRWPTGVRAGAAVGLLAVCGAAGWAIATYRPLVVPEAQVANRPIEVPEEGYVTSRTCRSCHPHHHATWDASFHSSMTQVPTPQTVVAPFDGRTLETRGRTYRLGRDGDRFWIEMDDPDWDSKEGPPPRVRRRIVLLTGSHHEQDYWYETPEANDRWIERVPFVYRIPEKRWIPDVSVLLTPPQSPVPFGRWNMNCIKCHTTFGRSRSIREGKSDSFVGEFGIACEACHGPAEEHVRLNGGTQRRYRLYGADEPDPTIVNPRRLEPRLASQVCGQCHGIWKQENQQAFHDWNEQGPAYRPGGEVEDKRDYMGHNENLKKPATIRFLERMTGYMDQRFWSDGMVRVSGREYNGLVETPCYTHGDEAAGIMSCLSCHTMHKPPAPQDPRKLEEWTDDQLTLHMGTNQACTQCHEGFETDEQITAHTHHPPRSSGSLCYNCHMPYTVWGLLKAIRSHEVDSPTVQASLETGRPNACNQCHLDKTLAWTADHLEQQYGTERPELDDLWKAVPASVIWAFSGDAGQRALMAWSLGWTDAIGACGSDWQAPVLAPLLADPYDAVRFAAGRSLRSLPGFREFEYDFVAPAPQRQAAADRALATWAQRRQVAGLPADLGFLLDDPQRKLPRDILVRLLKQRNDRRVHLAE